MKLVQITDLHVSKEGEYTHGVDVRQNFLDILEAARSFDPDHLILTGDLAFDTPNEEAYRWIKPHLDRLGIPYAIIGGNHDNSAMLARCFGLEHLLTGDELYYRLPLPGHPLLLLETSNGTMSGTQLAWVSKELALLGGSAVLFMHHPPLVGGVPHMDLNYPLRNMAEVQAVLHGHPHPIAIFCGHYHVEKMLCSKNLTVHITPSTYFSMKWDRPAFEVDHFRPALREIVLRDDGVVESTVVFYEGNKMVDKG